MSKELIILSSDLMMTIISVCEDMLYVVGLILSFIFIISVLLLIVAFILYVFSENFRKKQRYMIFISEHNVYKVLHVDVCKRKTLQLTDQEFNKFKNRLLLQNKNIKLLFYCANDF